MKRILICEDDNRKFEGIERTILRLFNEVEIKRVKYAKAAIIEIKENPDKYNFLIQDMQLPISSDDGIDTKGGIYVLNQIEYRQIDIKYCICSSDNSSYRSMIEAGYENIPFINYGSFQFSEDIKEFLES
jgi:hypothetical protein